MAQLQMFCFIQMITQMATDAGPCQGVGNFENMKTNKSEH